LRELVVDVDDVDQLRRVGAAVVAGAAAAIGAVIAAVAAAEVVVVATTIRPARGHADQKEGRSTSCGNATSEPARSADDSEVPL